MSDPSQEWRQSVEENGFGIVPFVLDREELSRLSAKLSGIKTPRGRAGIRHLLSTPAVAQLAVDRRLLQLAQAVLGPEAVPFRATLFDKSPDANWLIAWHQDTALPLMEKCETPGWGPWSVKEGVIYAHAPAEALQKVLAIRLHLDDSIEVNGPLRVLPGSHRHGVLSDQDVEAFVSNARSVPCLVDEGGAILMRPLLIHASSKSLSNAPRRVLHIEYATPYAVLPPLRLATT